MNAYNWFYDGHSIDYFFRYTISINGGFMHIEMHVEMHKMHENHEMHEKHEMHENAWKTWKTWNT